MIRFIYIGEAIDDEKRFAFFDTVTNKFATVNDNQTWTHAEDFIEDFDNDPSFETSERRRYIDKIVPTFKRKKPSK